MALVGKAYRASLPLVVLGTLLLVAAIVEAPFWIIACAAAVVAVGLAAFISWIVITQPTSGEG